MTDKKMKIATFARKWEMMLKRVRKKDMKYRYDSSAKCSGMLFSNWNFASDSRAREKSCSRA